MIMTMLSKMVMIPMEGRSVCYDRRCLAQGSWYNMAPNSDASMGVPFRLFGPSEQLLDMLNFIYLIGKMEPPRTLDWWGSSPGIQGGYLSTRTHHVQLLITEQALSIYTGLPVGTP